MMAATKRRKDSAIARSPGAYRVAFRGVETDPEREALPREGSYLAGKVEIEHIGVDNPLAAVTGERKRRTSARNRKTDALQLELSCGRISEAAFSAGRTFQRVAEAAGKVSWGGGGFEPSSCRGDREEAFALKALAMSVYVNWSMSIRRIVGIHAAMIVEGILIECRTLEGQAAHMGLRGWRGKNKVVIEFRASLEAVAREWEQRGDPGLSIGQAVRSSSDSEARKPR